MTLWTVIPDPADARKGILTGPLFEAGCALGRSGVRAAGDKVEGDGFTPLGRYPLRRVYYRPDRLAAPASGLPTLPLQADFGWCDEPASPDYNQLVRLPYGASHEKLWREDGVYDVILVIGHNDSPVVPNRGSAVFVHIAREGFTPTEGCVALEKAVLLRFLRQATAADSLLINYP